MPQIPLPSAPHVPPQKTKEVNRGNREVNIKEFGRAYGGRRTAPTSLDAGLTYFITSDTGKHVQDMHTAEREN